MCTSACCAQCDILTCSMTLRVVGPVVLHDVPPDSEHAVLSERVAATEDESDKTFRNVRKAAPCCSCLKNFLLSVLGCSLVLLSVKRFGLKCSLLSCLVL